MSVCVDKTTHFQARIKMKLVPVILPTTMVTQWKANRRQLCGRNAIYSRIHGKAEEVKAQLMQHGSEES